MKLIKKVLGALMCLVFMISATGCSSVTNGKRIVRVATMQSETHPEYLGLLKFVSTHLITPRKFQVL